MNRLIPMLVVLCALCTAAVLTAQGPDIKPDTVKFATVSFNAAVYQTAEAQKELKQLQAKFGPRQAELQALNADIEAARKQLGITNDKLSDAERAQREQALNNKEKQLQRRAEDFKNDSDSESQQVFQRIAQKVYSFLQSYSKQHGYTLVIERGSDAAPVVWYAADAVDITDQLVKSYDVRAASAPVKSQEQTTTPKQMPADHVPPGSSPK